MTSEVSKAQLQQLADEKLKDAQILLSQNACSNAYYLAGYAVELALKACIAKTFKADTIPDKAFVIDTYSHKLQNLVATAGLHPVMLASQKQYPKFATHWGIVNLWGPEARYASATTEEATQLLSAIGDSNHGVLPWIKQHW